MADLLLSGILNFTGTLDLAGDGGLVRANNVEVLVEVAGDGGSMTRGA